MQKDRAQIHREPGITNSGAPRKSPYITDFKCFVPTRNIWNCKDLLFYVFIDFLVLKISRHYISLLWDSL